ncbi:MAG: hypothetical protein DDT23_01093 [candidate division WS2 bacterium]|nr:hypothetical protein [Candidatus Lithacetigena glycinireducens]
MKTLTTKKVFIVICWNGLRSIPPREFPTIGELEQTAKILDLFAEPIPEFIEVFEEGEKLNTDILTKKYDEKEIQEKRTEYLNKSNLLEIKAGDEIVEIEFEDAEFNTFFQQFERWGKNWFFKLSAYLEFRKDLNATNSQPKEKE